MITNKIRLFACLGVMILGGLGCQKEFPEPELSEPVFWVEGEIDGKNVRLEAGENGAFLEADHRVDSFQVREFLGTFRPVACEDCGEALRIVIRDKATFLTGPTDPAVSFKAETLPFRGQVFETDSLTFAFKAQSNGTPPFSYEWDFGDASPISSATTEAEPTYTFSSDGLYEVSVRVQDANGCIDVSRHQVRAGSYFHHCQIGFSHQLQGDHSIAFKAEPLSAAERYQEVFWNFGDGQASEKEFEPLHSYDRPGIYEVKMVLIQADGSVCCDIKNVFSEEGASCASFIQHTPVPTDPFTGSVYIEWRDENDRLFTTDGPLGQEPENQFEILSVGPEWEDIDGQKAIQLSVRFDCRLYAQDNPSEFVELNGGRAEFAVAFP